MVIDPVRKFGTDLWATICDPWDAKLHVQCSKKGGAFVCKAGKGDFQVDVWGKSMETKTVGAKTYEPHNAGSVGRLKTWGMIYR